MTRHPEDWTMRCWPLAEIERRTGIPRRTLKRWTLENPSKIRSYRNGLVYYVNLDDVLRWIKLNR